MQLWTLCSFPRCLLTAASTLFQSLVYGVAPLASSSTAQQQALPSAWPAAGGHTTCLSILAKHAWAGRWTLISTYPPLGSNSLFLSHLLSESSQWPVLYLVEHCDQFSRPRSGILSLNLKLGTEFCYWLTACQVTAPGCPFAMQLQVTELCPDQAFPICPILLCYGGPGYPPSHPNGRNVMDLQQRVGSRKNEGGVH